MKDSIRIYRTGYEQYDDRNSGTAYRDTEQLDYYTCHKRSCNTESSSCSGKQRKKCKEINNSAEKSVSVFSDNRTTGFRISLTASLSYMKHKSERNSKYKIKSPWDKTPVEQRKYTCPLSYGTEISNMRISCIHYPFRE